MTQLICNIGVGVDVLEPFVRLQAEVPAELIQASHVPLAALQDPKNLYGSHGLRDVAGAERACAVFDSITDTSHQLVVIELPIGTTPESLEDAFGWVVGNGSLKLAEAHDHVSRCDVLRRFVKAPAVEVLNPLFILAGYA